MQTIARSWRALRILLLGIAPGLLPAAPVGAVPQMPGSNRPPVTCGAAIQHPIQVRVEALDVIRRGAAVRLRLTSRSRIGLSQAEARLVSGGGATVLGRPRASLGRVTPQREASAEFTVAVPALGDRFLVEFRVEGEGPAGRIGRGASFNILPDGPTMPARIVSGSAGQSVAEYLARRMPR